MAQAQELSSVHIDVIEGKAAEYRNRMRQRYDDNFPARAELERRIEAADADTAKCMGDYRDMMAEIADQRTKLPALREKMVKAEGELAAQLNVIQLLNNNAEKAKRLASLAAQDKAGYEAQLENRDYERATKQVRE